MNTVFRPPNPSRAHDKFLRFLRVLGVKGFYAPSVQVQEILPIHKAQRLSYMKLLDIPLGPDHHHRRFHNRSGFRPRVSHPEVLSHRAAELNGERL